MSLAIASVPVASEVFRRPLRQVLYASVFAGSALVCGANASESSSAFETSAWSAIAAGCLSLALRAPFVRIVARPTHVTFHNWLGNARVAWPDVAGFQPPGEGGSALRLGLRLKLRDGGYKYSAAYVAAPIDKGNFADDVVRDLHRLRSRYAKGE